MPTDPPPGRSLVTRRAIIDIIRTAALGSYGVTGFASGLPERVLGALGIGHPGIRVRFDDELIVELDLTVAYGLPVAEVARQVDSAIRYSLRRALDRDVTQLTIHVRGLRYQPGSLPPATVHEARSEPAPPAVEPE